MSSDTDEIPYALLNLIWTITLFIPRTAEGVVPIVIIGIIVIFSSSIFGKGAASIGLAIITGYVGDLVIDVTLQLSYSLLQSSPFDRLVSLIAVVISWGLLALSLKDL